MRIFYFIVFLFPVLLTGQSRSAMSVAAVQGDTRDNAASGTDSGGGEDFWIAPNPAENFLNIHKAFESRGDVQVSVYSLVGRRLHTYVPDQPEESVVLREDVSDWIPGTYLVRIETDGQILKTMRFVKR